MTDLRAYLTGPLCLESGQRLLAETALPGPQGRHLLGFLIAEHARPLSRDELADQLWPAAPPAAWENSLKSLVSKIRAALTRAGLPGAELIRNAFGSYQFRLPRDGWVDVDAAIFGVHLAEAALAASDLDEAELRRGLLPAAIRSAELVLELDSLRETAWQSRVR